MTARVLIVFARAPLPGKAKRRLMGTYGARGAARLYRRMAGRVLAAVYSGRGMSVVLSGASGIGHGFFLGARRRWGVCLSAQPRGDLGERMMRAMHRELAGAESVVLIGTDCLVMDAGLIEEAFQALEQGADAVFSPAEDGGYALVGLRQVDSRLFTAMPWGTAMVMRKTKARLRRLAYRVVLTRGVWDVDRPADVRRARRAGLL